MAVVIAPEVVTVQGIYRGIEATKNPDYCFIVWCPRNRQNIAIERKDVVKVSELGQLNQLEKGKNYNFEAEITVQQPREDGSKNYPAKLQFKLLKLV